MTTEAEQTNEVSDVQQITIGTYNTQHNEVRLSYRMDKSQSIRRN